MVWLVAHDHRNPTGYPCLHWEPAVETRGELTRLLYLMSILRGTHSSDFGNNANWLAAAGTTTRAEASHIPETASQSDHPLLGHSACRIIHPFETGPDAHDTQRLARPLSSINTKPDPEPDSGANYAPLTVHH